MKSLNLIAVSLCMVGSIAVNAQSSGEVAPEERAKSNASALQQELGLDQATAHYANELMLAAEEELTDVRLHQAKLQAEENAVMAKAYEQLSEKLDETQRGKLKEYMANGGKACCASAKAKTAGCSHEGAKPGCCAGKASTSTEKKKAESVERMQKNNAVATPDGK